MTIKRLLPIFVIIALLFSLIGCNSNDVHKQSEYIIDADDLSGLITKENVVLVDMQKENGYEKSHIKGAVNIQRSDIVVNEPYPNLLAPKDQIETVMGSNGISNDSLVIIYDDTKNMDAARLWWTLKIYGHDNAKVISGGFKALKDAGFETTSEPAEIKEVQFSAQDKDESMIAYIDDVKAQVNDPSEDVVILDVRTQKEFDNGTIPTSVLIDYETNNYKDNTYKSIETIKINYMEEGITPDKTVIMYCKTSIRAAQTYLALYNAGYTNLKIYDGAWIEWSDNEDLPVQMPSGNKIESNNNDNS